MKILKMKEKKLDTVEPKVTPKKREETASPEEPEKRSGIIGKVVIGTAGALIAALAGLIVLAAKNHGSDLEDSFEDATEEEGDDFEEEEVEDIFEEENN